MALRRTEPQQREIHAEPVVQGGAVVDPGVGGAAAGQARGLVAVDLVGRRVAVRPHDRRAVVADAESHAWDVELAPGVIEQVGARRGARLVALRPGALERLVRGVEADAVGELARDGGVAPGRGLPLPLVARRERRAAPALPGGGELPAEVHRVLDSGVVAEPAARREEVRGVAADEYRAAAEGLGDQGIARVPRRVAEHLDRALRPERLLDVGLSRLAPGGAGFLARLHLGGEPEELAAVERGDEAAPLAGKRPVHPRPLGP